MQYALVIEYPEGAKNYSAYVPDLPGCVSTGKTLEEVTRNMQQAIQFHIRGLREDGLEVPSPTSFAAQIEVAAQHHQRKTWRCRFAAGK